MSNMRPHCVPMALVAMVVCVFWLRDTSCLWIPSVGNAMMQPLDIDGVELGMLAVSVVDLNVLLIASKIELSWPRVAEMNRS